MNCFKLTHIAAALLLLSPIAAQAQSNAPAAPAASANISANVAADYVIGAGDELQVFVWKNPDLSVILPVRPDGKISTPLVADIQAQGKTPTVLAADLRTALGKYVQDPVVTVLVRTVATATGNAASIRVIGAAAIPKSVPYRAGMTVMDVMIDVGGLNTYAAGNDAQIIRTQNGASRSIPVHLNDLMKRGDMQANAQLMPGDVIRIPERWF